MVWQVPVGTFTPFPHCGDVVANIVDPYDLRTSPQGWLGYHEFVFDASWHPIPEGVC